MDMSHGGGEVSECVGDAFKPPPQMVGKDFEEKLTIQQIEQSLSDSVCVSYYNLVATWLEKI